jgi:predicted cupin superfamily sugar epimerase
MGHVDGWIHRLKLQPHPEGGWFRRIYTDARATPGADTRPWATSIHYLLTRESPVGTLHRNRSTILHYLQDGGPVEYWVLDPQGGLARTVLGFDPGEALFLAVPGGCWKGSRLAAGTSHALVSEVVVPGFDYADHEFMTAAQLAAHPQHAAALTPLLRVDAPAATSR